MRTLVVGAGIAGPTLAHWLARGGHDVVLVERAPARREGGYLIDFWGAGFDVAERMGIVPQLTERGYPVRELREVDDDGRTIARMDPRRVVARTGGRFVSIARSDLAAVIADTLEGSVETIFGDTVRTLTEHRTGVRVELESGASHDVDLVVGADGLHSRVRRLAFGEESEFERYLGIVVAVAVLDGYQPREELVGVTRTSVGAQVLRFAQRDGSTVVAFTFRHDGAVPLEDLTAQHELLRRRLGSMAWEVPAMLEQLPTARSFYLDRASQIRMPSWSRGRVVLLGDAAACASLLAGQGSALAMIEAYLLAHELIASPDDIGSALAAYQRRLMPFVRAKQEAATRMGIAFAPRSRTELLLRNTAIRAARVPWLADLAIGSTLRDAIDLPPTHLPPMGG